MADEQLRDDVRKLLDNIDWNSVSEFENLRATVERNPQIAEQLVYGEMTSSALPAKPSPVSSPSAPSRTAKGSPGHSRCIT